MVDTPLKIIFLDIDGVVNSDRYIRDREAPPVDELWTSADLDPSAVEALNAIIVRTGAVERAVALLNTVSKDGATTDTA